MPKANPIYHRRDQGWSQPTSADVREFLAAHGLTELAAARIVGIGGSDSNAARTMRRYKSGDRPIPYHIWRLLVLELKCGIDAETPPLYQCPVCYRLYQEHYTVICVSDVDSHATSKVHIGDPKKCPHCRELQEVN